MSFFHCWLSGHFSQFIMDILYISSSKSVLWVIVWSFTDTLTCCCVWKLPTAGFSVSAAAQLQSRWRDETVVRFGFGGVLFCGRNRSWGRKSTSAFCCAQKQELHISFHYLWPAARENVAWDADYHHPAFTHKITRLVDSLLVIIHFIQSWGQPDIITSDGLLMEHVQLWFITVNAITVTLWFHLMVTVCTAHFIWSSLVRFA